MKEETIIRISVRSLVEFILREGDIDNRVSGSMEKDAMLLGGKIHRKIQSRMGTNYTAEVPLKIQMPCDGFVLQIEGRADGVLKDDGKVLIDEIKGILRSLEHLEAPVPVHLAQAKCYAYIYAVQNSLKCIDVQMTYCQMETEEIRRFCQKFEFQELQRRTARPGGLGIPHDLAKEKAVYPGAYRSGKNNGNCISGSAGSGGRAGRKDFLSDSEDDYEDSCRAGIFPVERKGAVV